MKRILLVSPFPPFLGGVSVSVQRLYDVLINAGFTVVKFNTHPRYLISKSLRPLKYLRYMTLPFFLMTHKRFDVIHFHVSGVFTKMYIATWRFLFSDKTQFIISIHGEVGHVLASRFGFFSLSRFDKIICVKSGDTENLPSSLRGRSVEIPGFIPPLISEDSNDKIPAPLKQFLKRDTFKLMVNGSIIVNQKFNDLYGFRDSVLLLEQLLNLGKNVDLILITLGSPADNESRDYLNNLRDYTRRDSLVDHVVWIENANIELWPVLKNVHAFLRPTKSDGDALSVREALFLKIPVIASDVVPRPGDTILFKLNSDMDFLNKTLVLIENYEDYIARLGENSTSFAQKIIEQYEN